MPANYVLLEKITVGAAGASEISFTGIPQTGYTDLLIKISARTTVASNFSTGVMYINTNTSNGSWRNLAGDGSSAFSTNASGYIDGMYFPAASSTSSTFGNAEVYIPNYTSSSFKSISVDGVNENNATQAYSNMRAILWSSTAAITSWGINAGSGANFAAGSTFYLYGVAKLGTEPAIVPYATGGDTIMTDGTYWYHTFVSSGTFTPQKSLSVDYLVVAGGGGGGGTAGAGGVIGGGGGGGGYRSLAAQSLAPNTAFTVTIGAGGAGSSSNGSSASNSSFGSTATTGGGGAGQGRNATPGNNGLSGGSGGGAGGSGATPYPTGGAGNAGSYSPVEGFAGGNGFAGGQGAGGGGAGGSPPVNGAVGPGAANSISGSSVTYSVGGSGAGAAGSGVVPTAKGANTGNGGDGGFAANGGNGGSGIVIVRYAV
jgi:hypothetical protein